MSHLYFNELNNAGRKTRFYEVTATASDEILGTVTFRGAWRKYVFNAGPNTLFDASCLREIADFTEAETTKWREEVRPRPAPDSAATKEPTK